MASDRCSCCRWFVPWHSRFCATQESPPVLVLAIPMPERAKDFERGQADYIAGKTPIQAMTVGPSDAYMLGWLNEEYLALQRQLTERGKGNAKARRTRVRKHSRTASVAASR